MGNIALVISFLFFAGCGKSLPVTKLNPIQREQALAFPLAELNGEIETTDGNIIQVSADRQKPLVLVFASDSCAVCTAEARALVAHLNEMSASDLANVDYYTVLIGAYPEDLSAWIRRLDVSWTAGTQEGDSMFEKFCPEKLTPCIITFDPAFQRLTKFLGETPIEKLQQQTGAWTYVPKEI